MDFHATPNLTEPGVKYFLQQSLKQAHAIREQFHNFVFNIGMGILFVVLFGSLLYYKYKGKPTKAEQFRMEQVKRQYILDRIQNYQISKLREEQHLITGLPHWVNEYKEMYETPHLPQTN